MRVHSYLAAAAMLAMRAVSLAGKFALVVAISHWMPIEAVGTYGLVLGATIIFSVVGGLGLGLNVSRDLVAASPGERWLMLSRLGLSFLSVYAVVVAVAVISAVTGVFSVALAALGTVILVAEHLSAELTRILITLKRPVIGNLLLFVRNGLWVCAVFVAFWAFPALRHIEAILFAWAAGAMASAAIGAFACKEYAACWRSIRLANHFRWLSEHVSRSRNIFAAMSMYVVLQYADRFIIDHMLGRQATGIFTLCWSLANAVMVVTSTLIIQTHYPKLIGVDGSAGGLAAASRQLIAKANLCAAVSAFVLGAAFVVGYPYIRQLSEPGVPLMFTVLLVCTVVRVNCEVLFYISYSQKWDRKLRSTMIGVLILILSSSPMIIYYFDVQGILISQVTSTAIMLIAVLWNALPILNERRIS